MLRDHPTVVAQLNEELIGWLTTVNEVGQPQASAIWHVNDGNDLVVYSRADAVRLTNLQSNPRVAFNLRADARGDTFVTLEGRATIDPTLPSPIRSPAYMTKYGDEMIRLGWSHEEYDEEFPIALRIAITRIRAS